MESIQASVALLTVKIETECIERYKMFGSLNNVLELTRKIRYATAESHMSQALRVTLNSLGP